MDDFVSRKAAITTAEEYRQRMIQAFHNADCDELIAVACLPTEKEFEHLEWLLKTHYKKESRWIPVTERLPEDGAEVWVTTEMLFEVTRARWHEDSNLWCHPYYSDCLLVLRPIAWMEISLPEPYKGEHDG